MNIALDASIGLFGPSAFAAYPWLQALQKQQNQAFIQRGLPTRREEAWKYTDVTFLAEKKFRAGLLPKENYAARVNERRLKGTESLLLVFINGNFVANLSDLRLLPKEVMLCNIQQALKVQPALVQKYLTFDTDAQSYPFASLNMALMTDGVFLYVPKNIVLDLPIHLLFLSANQDDFVSSPRNIIVADKSSQVTVLEEYSCLASKMYFTNAVTEIHAEDNAQIQYYKIQNEGLRQVTHIAKTSVNQRKDSQVKTVTLSTGGQVARDDLQVSLHEKGAECSVNGFYALHEDGQHRDNHIWIDHIATHGTSDMVYKGILEKKSQSVFNGMVYVHPDAQKTLAHQANHNLMLSADAIVNTKPEFEIYADDVKCAHGDTVGQLDAEALFFLRSRGIEEKAALKILAQAFAAEVLERVTNPAIAQHMQKVLDECQV